MRTFLKVLSILLIIGAAISIVLGVVTIGGGGVIAGLGGYGNMGLTADESFGAALVGGVAVVMGIFLILSAAFNLITGIFGIIGANGGTGKLKAALEQAYNNKLLVYQSEIKFLQAQVNPHFLYNSFYHLYRMAKMEDNEGVAEMSRRLSSYYRYITRSDQNEVPLTMEYQNISDYTEIQTIRFGDRIKVELEPIPPGYEALMVPRFVLQPLFENAYNHGVEKIAAGRIQLRFELRPGALVILVENNGTCGDEELRALTAYLESTAPGEKLTALKNVKGRMKLLDGDLAVSHGSLGGFCAELTLSVPKDLTANIDKNEREKEEK